MNDYEVRNNHYLRSIGAECTVLLKKDGHFPLEKAGDIAVYGSGARNTIKGGTGSGEVNSRFYVTVEQGLEEAGFTITSKDWIDGYDQVRADAHVQFIKDIKQEAKERKQQAIMISMGRSMPEPNYQLPLNGKGDTAIYVLSRLSGEGTDRSDVAGEVSLSDTEIRDILACNEKYDNFMLVLNVGGVVDLTPVKDVKNILILSQLGVVTGQVLADILLGVQNPSGKLTTTWSAWEDYLKVGEFGEKHDTHYNEDIYVGYRYFDSVGKRALFPFGYGLSYTEFAIENTQVALEEDIVTVVSQVKNIGASAGKEVVQVYVSSPEGKLDQPYQALAGFGKTAALGAGQSQEVTISFSMKDIASYDEASASYILEAGDYVIRVGANSVDTEVAVVIRMAEEVVVIKAKNVFGKADFEDYKIPAGEKKANNTGVTEATPILTLDSLAIKPRKVNYDRTYEIDPKMKEISDDQLVKLNMGAFVAGNGLASIIGNAGFTVAGAAGQTSMEAESFGVKSMVMADGPAGLRLSREYAVDKKGEIHSFAMPFPESLLDFMPGIMKSLMKLTTYKPKKTDVIKHQYATAIPIGTALAQSFNLELAEACGKLVGEEMEMFGVHLWLAPALNLHRSILCGRNFEYYSEDPLVSGLMAGAITLGVQSFTHTGTTIKHFAFNNQERNRTQNNSIMSERVARELYLKGFAVCVRMSQPKAVMTSYNLINGTHTAEHRGLIEDILRAEYGYEGLVMTDWTIAGYENEKDCVHPVTLAENTCMAGNDLFMPGSKHDYDGVMAGLASGKVTREQLEINATRVAKMAEVLVK